MEYRLVNPNVSSQQEDEDSLKKLAIKDNPMQGVMVVGMTTLSKVSQRTA
mgnify:CR=1 FL=1